MFDGLSLKLLEAGALLVAGVAFVWWQLSDVKRAQAASAARKAAEEKSNELTGSLPPQQKP